MSDPPAATDDATSSAQLDEAVPLLRARGLSKSYPGVQALSEVDLDLYGGEIHALVGENGAGKSTLLKCLFGVVPPDSGTIDVAGTRTAVDSPAAALRLGIAMVHQELSLVPQLDAVRNVVLGREPTRFGRVQWRAARREAEVSLERLGFAARLDVPVRRLSLAQQQLVELARAIATDARVIILDEPTASLTTQESHQLFEVLDRLRADGRALAYVSHRLVEVLDLAQSVTVLRDGELIATRPRSEITGEEELVRLMVGRDVEALGVPGDTQAGEEVLRVEGLSAPSGVHDASLVVRRGEVVGLAGMVGAGRTELARAIIGADRRTTGTIAMHGEPVRIRRPADAIAAGIAYLPEDRKSQGLALHMSIASNTTLLSPPSRLGIMRHREQRHVARDALTPLDMKTPVGSTARTLSGGNQQKVVLARWLLSHSDLFIFDEPTRGIDVGAKGEIHRLMRDLADAGKGVLMISSDLPEVLRMSDRVLVMRSGQIVADLPREDADEETVVAAAAGQ